MSLGAGAPAFDSSIHKASSHDVDVQAALLQGWNQDYAQISAGVFAGSLVETGFSGVKLFIESTSQALLQRGALSEDVVAIGVPLKLAGTAVFCGTPSREAAVHVFSGKDGFEFYSPAGLVMCGIVASREVLFALLSMEERIMVELILERAHLAVVGDGELAAMRDFVKAVLDLAGVSPQLLCNASLRQALREGVLSNLTHLLLSCCPVREPRLRIGHRWKIVLRAREAALARAGTPTNIEDICRAAGVSRRTLQYCFQDILGITPAEFLRAVRLDGVRRMLRTASSVTDAATHWGFWHLGYFSRDYRNMFGELPSQTHRRYRNSALSRDVGGVLAELG
jgi:AraC family ethanolamine operon transcriptional activator